ncbi:type IX secretion system membrane protein PorP/SprF [Capnocytophaga canimorsus]|nr:type IX secretion system membrane protein PorP/SprF [Capnocytophaga canimorsus]WGU69054.1 type IX secretion system membrane protein PorP/SprF [Capnocytophaga canimorsus]
MIVRFLYLRTREHYYLIGGYVFDLSDSVKFKPAALSKLAYGTPLQLDLSANFMFNERFVLGGRLALVGDGECYGRFSNQRPLVYWLWL